ncbi:flagellar hook-length control protein FliK [Dechloromonas sp. HYN0024]|uniref:flagellar hook-length control protein FliK n=1 Tax=Dechloromonas sp. HYN0024 TaxID=2231055 RepID=UPI000E43A71B|nr:flagellar hook-length control protein FliK [Dechloromonas sp. HYN0024]AXS79185.1 flagellar hook-length control protein FliK [Dechloromonas sp. HYN0024]
MSITTIPGLPAAIGGKSALPGTVDSLLESGLPLDFAALLAEQIPTAGQTDPTLLTGEAPVAGQTADIQALDDLIAKVSAAVNTEQGTPLPPVDDKRPIATTPSPAESAASVLAALSPAPRQPQASASVAEAENKKMPDDKARKEADEAELVPTDPSLVAQYLAPQLVSPLQNRPQPGVAEEKPSPADQLAKAISPGAAAKEGRKPLLETTRPATVDTPPATLPATSPATVPLAEPRMTQRSETANAAILAGDGNPGNSGYTPAFTSALAATGTSATAASTPPSQPAAISTPLNEPGWPHDFGNRIVWLAKNDQQVAQININPPQLGPVQISISLNGDQASATFASPHPEVRQAIQDSLPQLREMFSTAGISLGQANVGSHMPSQNREASYQFANEARSSGENAILSPDSHASSAPAGIPIQRGRGLVDLFA